MRKESTRIVDAFLSRKKAVGARTHTDGDAMYLHGNKIAWHGENGKIHATMSGWGTKTTRDRLNTLVTRLGAKKFSQKKNVQHHGDMPISPEDVVDMNEAHDEKSLYSKARHHSQLANSIDKDAKLTRYLGREGQGVYAPSRFKDAEKLERRSKQHFKAEDAAKRLLMSLKVSGKKNTKDL